MAGRSLEWEQSQKTCLDVIMRIALDVRATRATILIKTKKHKRATMWLLLVIVIHV